VAGSCWSRSRAGLAFTLTLRALVFIVPGVLMLVPGSAGYNSVLQLVTDQTISGITAGFDTFVTAISIAYGLMVSTVVLPRRSTRIAIEATIELGLPRTRDRDRAWRS
jgi:uncharacterized membrane protein YjjB (DUF3815 family)